MKKLNHLLFAGVIAASIGLADSVNAQFKVDQDDGIAASPRARKMLNEQKRMTVTPVPGDTATPVIVAGVEGAGTEPTAASPKARQLMEERRTSVSSSELAAVGYRATGPDGITASPKVRQQLDERSVIMVAPVK